uniref:Uncharacterized protein n=1 Tax=Utricularia reniformis TaxID=192314 RepID=A0A1Y0B2F5_9LAMI|nr:hypothetical protein AEK19_MT1443 [Utricularia reniformis]ART31635.1 hypothetical protein AEK19_MT1443 [Utricularia reniformis]
MGFLGWLPEGLSDPIHCLSRSARTLLLFYERDSIQICHSLGREIRFNNNWTV